MVTTEVDSSKGISSPGEEVTGHDEGACHACGCTLRACARICVTEKGIVVVGIENFSVLKGGRRLPEREGWMVERHSQIEMQGIKFSSRAEHMRMPLGSGLYSREVL